MERQAHTCLSKASKSACNELPCLCICLSPATSESTWTTSSHTTFRHLKINNNSTSDAVRDFSQLIIWPGNLWRVKLHWLTSYWSFSLLTSIPSDPCIPKGSLGCLSCSRPPAKWKGRKTKGIIIVKRVTVWNIMVEDVDPVLELQPVEKTERRKIRRHVCVD